MEGVWFLNHIIQMPIERDSIVKTVKGEEIRIICTDNVGDFPIVGLDKEGIPIVYTSNGSHFMSGGEPCEDNLDLSESA